MAMSGDGMAMVLEAPWTVTCCDWRVMVGERRICDTSRPHHPSQSAGTEVSRDWALEAAAAAPW